jgi:hypothetical protein
VAKRTLLFKIENLSLKYQKNPKKNLKIHHARCIILFKCLFWYLGNHTYINYILYIHSSARLVQKFLCYFFLHVTLLIFGFGLNNTYTPFTFFFNSQTFLHQHIIFFHHSYSLSKDKVILTL